MRRTQIYITDEQDRGISDRAADSGVSKAQVIRRMLDAGLDIDNGADARRRAIQATAGVLADADDWDAWLDSVRGTGASERLSRLGS
jgi:hypothetical protein